MAVGKTPHTRGRFKVIGSGPMPPPINHTIRPLDPVTPTIAAKCDIVEQANRRVAIRKLCDVCGRAFNAFRNDKRYCGPTCRKAISRFHSREHNIGALTLFCDLYPFSRIAMERNKGVRHGS